MNENEVDELINCIKNFDFGFDLNGCFFVLRGKDDFTDHDYDFYMYKEVFVGIVNKVEIKGFLFVNIYDIGYGQVIKTDFTSYVVDGVGINFNSKEELINKIENVMYLG